MDARRRLGWQCPTSTVQMLVVVGLLWLGMSSTANAGGKAWSPTPLPEGSDELPQPREVMQAVLDFMGSHDRLSFEAVATYEVVQDSGQKLHFDMLHRVVFERSRRVHWVTLYDDAAIETAWLADGTFTMVRQPANVWGKVRVPSLLTAAVTRVSDEYEVTVPFVDLLSGDLEELWLGDDVEWAEYVGEAWIDGQWTDHIALRRPGSDAQLWFRQGDEPFLVKMVLVHTDQDGLPMFSAHFAEWSTHVADDSIQEFVPPEGSEQLEIVPIARP